MIKFFVILINIKLKKSIIFTSNKKDMKYILSTLFSLVISICLSQQIDYSHFNTDLMNKAMLKEFNMYRRSLSLDTLVYSEELYKTFSKPNCVEVSNSGGFYHPYINTIWATSDIKPRIAQESLNKIVQEIANLRASERLTSAQTKNVQENIAPSPDPFWYRDTKRMFSKGKQAIDSTIEKSYKSGKDWAKQKYNQYTGGKK
jgi:hypothetical protein